MIQFITTSCYNPFFWQGLEIDQIVIYKDGIEIASFSWFGSNNNYKYMNLPIDQEVKKAVKLNLNRQDCFYMRSKHKDWCVAYNIYIHADLINMKYLGREVYIDDWKQHTTREAFELTVTGRRWEYELDENRKAKQVWKEGEFSEKIYCNYVTEEKAEWKKCDAIAKRWKELACVSNLSAYDVHQIMQEYKIIKKKK